MSNSKRKRGRPPGPEIPVMGEPARITGYVQVDYLAKLSGAEKRWLKKFEREYYYNRGLKEEQKPLHGTKKLRCAVFKRNREAAQEIGTKTLRYVESTVSYFAKTRASGGKDSTGYGESSKYDAATVHMEDPLIDYLDSKRAAATEEE